MTPRVFISYRTSDGADKATALARELDALFGDAQVFLDKDDLPAGSRWRDVIAHTLGAPPVLLGSRSTWTRSTRRAGAASSRPTTRCATSSRRRTVVFGLGGLALLAAAGGGWWWQAQRNATRLSGTWWSNCGARVDPVVRWPAFSALLTDCLGQLPGQVSENRAEDHRHDQENERVFNARGYQVLKRTCPWRIGCSARCGSLVQRVGNG